MTDDFDHDGTADDTEEGDPECAECGCDLFTEEHAWDCSYGEDDDE